MPDVTVTGRETSLLIRPVGPGGRSAARQLHDAGLIPAPTTAAMDARYAGAPQAAGDGVADDGPAINAWLAAPNPVGGLKRATPGAIYRTTQLIASVPGQNVDWAGATILIDRNDTSNTYQIATGAGSTWRNLKIDMVAGRLAHRHLNIGQGSVIDGLTMTAASIQTLGNDNDDAAIDVNSGRLQNYTLTNYDGGILIRGDYSVVRYGRHESFVKAIRFRSHPNWAVVDRIQFGAESPNASATAGHNAIGGAPGNHCAVSNIKGLTSGEHFIYFAPTFGLCTFLTMSKIHTAGSGQCGIKLRGVSRFSIVDFGSTDTSNDNRVGSNEDAIRLENCEHGFISSGASRIFTQATGTNVGIVMQACRSIQVRGFHIQKTRSHAIHLLQETTFGWGACTDISIDFAADTVGGNVVRMDHATLVPSNIHITGRVRTCTGALVYWNAPTGTTPSSVTLDYTGSIGGRLTNVLASTNISALLRPHTPGLGIDLQGRTLAGVREFDAALPSRLRLSYLSRYDEMYQAISEIGWELFDAFYVFGGQEVGHAVLNLKSPAALLATASSGMSWVRDEGYQGNGASHSVEIPFNPSAAAGAWALNSAHIGAYVVNNAQDANNLVGISSSTGANQRHSMRARDTSDQFRATLNDGTVMTVTGITDSRGHWLFNRSAADAREAYRDGVLIGSDTVAASSLSNGNVTVFRQGMAFNAAHRAGVFHFGTSLTGAQVADAQAAIARFRAGLA